ncbi:GSCOCG00010800001-RA-CDS [Cotesia congregata]|nr:GSCOCG00010800001-RA-CDS [Cotesia congregata]
MVNKRLIWYLGKINWFTPAQNGFRKYHSTTLHLAQLQNFISNAFQHSLHVIAIQLDLQKAYEIVWKKRIVESLTELGINNNLLHYIKNFLSDRTIQVKVEETRSEFRTLENGVPQGSVISVTLFLIAINDIIRCIPPSTKALLYADDLTVYCSGKSIKNICELLQETLNNLSTWCEDTGFRFAENKTEYMVFTRSHQYNKFQPLLSLNNTILDQRTMPTKNRNSESHWVQEMGSRYSGPTQLL